MSRFLLFSGPFHAGQRERALHAVSAAAGSGARDVLYLVPSGAAKRDVIEALARRQVSLFGVRVLTIDALPAELERRAYIISPARSDAVVDRMLAERATREACRELFPASAPLDGLARQVMQTIGELERNGAGPEAIDREARQLGGQGAEILCRAWEVLCTLRAGRGRSGTEALADAIRLLGGSPGVLAGCDLLVVESVPLTRALDAELIGALVRAAPARVIAAYEAAQGLSTAPSTLSLVRLRSLAAWDEQPCVRRSTPAEQAFETLFTAADPVAGRGAHRAEHGVHVRLLEAPTDVGEVRLVARVVQRHLDAGVAPEDIQLVVHAGRRYRALVGEIFAEHEIPAAAERARSAAETGLGEVLLRLLHAALAPHECTRDEALALIRAPHLDLGEADGDRFERAILRHGLLGPRTWGELPDGAISPRARKRVARFCSALETAHADLQALADPADAARVVRSLARELRLIGNAFFARMRVLRRAGDAPRLRARIEAAIREDNQAWEEIEGTLDRMPQLLEAAHPSLPRRGLPLAERWTHVLARALRVSTVSAAHPPAGVVRLVGTGPGTLRPARVTFVFGMLERVFPRGVLQDALLGDAARRHLRARHGWHLPLAEELADHEREAFLRAVLSATEVLYLARAATDARGRPTLRSFYLEDLERALPYTPDVEHEHLSALVAPLAEASRAGDLLAALSHDIWQHLPPEIEAPRRAAAFAAHDSLVEHGVAVGPVRGARLPTLRPTIAPELLEDAPHRTLRLSASQLRTISHCTYQHFVEKVLAPQVLDGPQFDELTRGGLIHAALAEWALGLDGWRRGEAALPELEAWLAARVARYERTIRDDPAAQHGLEQSRARLVDFLRAELALLATTGARPSHHELAFGEARREGGLYDPASRDEAFTLAVPTPEHGTRTVHIRGSIDRIDVFEHEGRRYGVAIDYKTGRSARRYGEQMLKGEDLQLRLYLLALQQLWGIEPAGALYLGFGDGLRHGAVRADLAAYVPERDLRGRKIAQFDAAAWGEWLYTETPQRIGEVVSRLVGLDIVAAPRGGDCGLCSLRTLCRYGDLVEEAIDA